MEILSQIVSLLIGIAAGIVCMKLVHLYVDAFYKNESYTLKEIKKLSRGSHLVRLALLLFGVYAFYYPLFEHEVWVWGLVWGYYEYKNLCMRTLSLEVELKQLKSSQRLNYVK